MGKQSKRDLEKILDAKTKGKQPRKKVATDDTRPEAAELDSRITKNAMQKGIIVN